MPRETARKRRSRNAKWPWPKLSRKGRAKGRGTKKAAKHGKLLTSVVKFHSPHCGHCQALAPVWDQLDAWGKTQGTVRIVAYDETVRLPEGEDLKAKYGIRVHGYPTIVKIVEVPGQPPRVVEYQGNRQLTDLVAFARRND